MEHLQDAKEASGDLAQEAHDALVFWKLTRAKAASTSGLGNLGTDIGIFRARTTRFS